MSMEKEHKIKIAARLFFDDNQEEYENYEQSVEGLRDASDEFLDHVVKNFYRNKPGHRSFYNPEDGHIISLRTSDDWLEPVTAMSKEYGDEIHEKFRAASIQREDFVSTAVLLQDCGWILL
jgi:hypothetical protein